MPLAILPLLILTLSAGPQPPAGWTDGYVQANGIRIHYWRTGGDKPVLVLAHGSSDDGLCWTNLAREFQKDFDIVMFDARGHGLSDPPTPSDAPDVQVEDLAGLIKELKLNKPILMGHSMGSASVANFAAKYPDVPLAVILEDPALVRPATPPAASQTTPESRRANILARNNTSEAALVDGSWKLAEMGTVRMRVLGTVETTPSPKYRAHQYRKPTANERAFSEDHRTDLILKADADDALKKQNEQVAGLLASGKIVHIKGAGHNVRREGRKGRYRY